MRAVISNCGTPTEKVSEFLVHHLKRIMQKGLSYIRDSQHFLEKIKTFGSVPENATLVSVDVVVLYPNILHQAGLKALKEALKKRDIKKIPTEHLVKMAEFVLNNNIFEFNSKAYQQKSGTAIGTKFVFTPGPIVSCRNARKISSYLVRAKLYPLERKVGSEKCGKSRCEVCLNIHETDTFTSTTTGESFKINHDDR